MPVRPALCRRTILAPISGPWSFPVSKTRRGMKRAFPCNDVFQLDRNGGEGNIKLHDAESARIDMLANEVN